MQKNLLWDELHPLEEGEENEESLSRKNEVVTAIEKVLLMEEISWKQKSMVLWLKGG